MRDIICNTDAKKLGGWQYPILSRFYANAEWYIISTPISQAGVSEDADASKPESWQGYYEAGQDKAAFKPTLRWTHDNTVTDLYIRSKGGRSWIRTAAFIRTTGLELSMLKGGFVLSKRLSRIMRRYISYGFMEDIDVRYMQQDETEKKLWDGAAVVSRALLLRLIDQLPSSLDARKRQRMVWELRNCSRVEFTLLTKRGQDKGHALVSDSLDADLLLPMDTKAEVKLKGAAFFGVNPIHGSDEMRLDMQSMVNLYPFFDVEYLLKSLREEGAFFVDSLEAGRTEAALNRIDGLREGDISDWHVAEYFASGGKAFWFSNMVQSLMNQQMNRLEHTTLGKMRVPVLGGRYYLITDTVGLAAGQLLEPVPRGYVKVDGKATIYVNSADWLEFVAKVLGGADSDDSAWVHPFTDHDNQRKLLIWRSPNQLGEYLVLKPTADSHEIVWEAVQGKSSWRKADSRRLATRTDLSSQQYLNLIDERTAGGLGEGLGYSIDTMQLTIERLMKNAGALGWMCNLAMVQVASKGKMFTPSPAPLEQVIDSSVKTGADLSEIKAWCAGFVQDWIARQEPVPYVLGNRLIASFQDNYAQGKAIVPILENHWTQILYTGIESHIGFMAAESKRLAAKAAPPEILVEAGRPYTDLSKPLRKAYVAGFQEISDNRVERAGQYMLKVLDGKTEREAIQMMLGLIADVYLSREAVVSDGVLWHPAIAKYTLAALRDMGVLSEIQVLEDGRLAATPRLDLDASNRRLRVTNVWFNSLKASNRTSAALPSQVKDKALMQSAKAQVAEWAKIGAFIGRCFKVAQMEGSEVLVSENNGKVMGYIARQQYGLLPMGTTVKVSLTNDDGDGNMVMFVR